MYSTTITKLVRPHLFLLHHCTSMKDIMKFHAHIITSGLSTHTLLLSAILSFTSLSPAGDLPYSHLLLNHIHSPNTFMFNTIIRASTYPIQAISLYIHMLQSGLSPNNYTFPFLIKASSKIKNNTYGQTIHSSIIKYGHMLDLHIANSLLHMYARFGFSKQICRLFDEIPDPDVVSWNVLVDDFAKCGWLDEVLGVLNEMCYFGVQPNSVTLLGVLCACTKAGDLSVGKWIHLYMVKKDVDATVNLRNGLLDMYCKFGDMDSAQKLFDRMDVKTVFSWTSLIDGFVQKGELKSASVLFHQMPEKDLTAWNVMLNGYIIGGNMTSAEMVFTTMPERDLVSWNCMVVGYAQKKKFVKALEFFKEMLILKIKPDRITLASVLSVCQFGGALDLGEVTHAYMEKQNIKGEDVELALMDMYCKCGAPEKAVRVFDGIKRKSVLPWSTIIVGLAMNGLANEAIEFFNRMQNAAIKPNEVTFIGLLCACSYAGLVEEGQWFFNAMSQVYGMKPRSEHLGCMVDILGRAGLLKEAEVFIQNLPVKADAGVLGALLGACRMHCEVQMGERVTKILTEMDPFHSGRYILMSNIYAAENRWVEAENVRKKMKASRVQKMPGFSLIVLKGEMHQFLSGNTS